MPDNEGSFRGIALVGITGGAAVALSVLCYPFVSPALRKICLPYVPATTRQIQNVLSLLQKGKGNVIDLGSGDGRIVFAAAEAGYKAHGVELNPWLVAYSRIKAIYLGVNGNVKFYRKDLWKMNLTPYENIVVFGVDEMMAELEKKLDQELSKNARVIACRFPFPSWMPIASLGTGIDTAWLYKVDDTNAKVYPTCHIQK